MQRIQNNVYGMSKTIFTLLFSAALLMGAPLMMEANSAIELIDNDYQSPSVMVSGSTLRVTNANGLVLQVYNVAGVRVASFKVEGNDRSYSLNLRHGCYIVKVGKTVRKVSVS